MQGWGGFQGPPAPVPPQQVAQAAEGALRAQQQAAADKIASGEELDAPTLRLLFEAAKRHDASGFMSRGRPVVLLRTGAAQHQADAARALDAFVSSQQQQRGLVVLIDMRSNAALLSIAAPPGVTCQGGPGPRHTLVLDDDGGTVLAYKYPANMDGSVGGVGGYKAAYRLYKEAEQLANQSVLRVCEASEKQRGRGKKTHWFTMVQMAQPHGFAVRTAILPTLQPLPLAGGGPTWVRVADSVPSPTAIEFKGRKANLHLDPGVQLRECAQPIKSGGVAVAHTFVTQAPAAPAAAAAVAEQAAPPAQEQQEQEVPQPQALQAPPPPDDLPQPAPALLPGALGALSLPAGPPLHLAAGALTDNEMDIEMAWRFGASPAAAGTSAKAGASPEVGLGAAASGPSTAPAPSAAAQAQQRKRGKRSGEQRQEQAEEEAVPVAGPPAAPAIEDVAERLTALQLQLERHEQHHVEHRQSFQQVDGRLEVVVERVDVVEEAVDSHHASLAQLHVQAAAHPAPVPTPAPAVAPAVLDSRPAAQQAQQVQQTHTPRGVGQEAVAQLAAAVRELAESDAPPQGLSFEARERAADRLVPAALALGAPAADPGLKARLLTHGTPAEEAACRAAVADPAASFLHAWVLQTSIELAVEPHALAHVLAAWLGMDKGEMVSSLRHCRKLALKCLGDLEVQGRAARAGKYRGTGRERWAKR